MTYFSNVWTKSVWYRFFRPFFTVWYGKPTAAALEETNGFSTAPGPSRTLVPWLVKRYFSEGQVNYAFYDIYGPNKETPIPELSGKNFYQKPCHQGWLIVLCNYRRYDYTPRWNYGDCFLWNPMTNETIQLPTILEFCEGEYGIVDCVLSSPPPRMTAHDNNKNNNDSIVLFFLYNGTHEEKYTFLFCRPGETQWRIHKLSRGIEYLIISERFPKSVLCIKNKFYIMCTDEDNIDEHLDYHLEIQHYTKGTNLTLSVKPFHVKKEVVFPLVAGKAHPESHYVETHGEIFRVDIIHSSIGAKVISIEVVRLNFLLMKWGKVNSFGDHVLFIGSYMAGLSSNTTSCSSATQLGFTSGCLYYLLDDDRSLNKFEIESSRHTVTSPCLWPTEDFDCSHWVMMPANVHDRVENIFRKDEDSSFLVPPQEIQTCNTMVSNGENQGGNCNAGEVEVTGYWNNLNEDILGLITNHLHGSDYKHFRSVCKANREMIPKVQTTSYLSPWLVFSRDHNRTIFSVVNPMYNDENYIMNLSDLAGSTIRFQKGGWLLMTRKHNIFFYNPFTRETVKLPDTDKGYSYSVVSFSSLPTSSDCIVFAMDEKPDKFYIDCIRKGETQWSFRIFASSNITKYTPFTTTAAFHGEAFFCVDYHETTGVFSAKDNSWKVVEKPNGQSYEDCSSSFVVECAADLLLVKLRGFFETSVRIFKLNFSEMEWVEVESLGEHMLFISQTSCLSAVAPNNYMKNKIYFPRLHVNDGGIVLYSLDTRSYHSVGSHNSTKDLYDTEGWFKNCSWIKPNRLMSTAEELDWLKTP